MAKNRFFGKYYKFVNGDGFSFAFIKSHANEGDMLQVITPEGAFYLKDPHAIKVDGEHIEFDVREENLSMVGELHLGELHPLKHKVMGPFTYLPMECSHEIYSMFHEVNGSLVVNGKDMDFSGSLGYIEGDKGTNFPSKYIWYNSILPEATVTLAIASIPLFGFIHFTGLLCFIKTKDKDGSTTTITAPDDKPISIDKDGEPICNVIVNGGNQTAGFPAFSSDPGYPQSALPKFCQSSYPSIDAQTRCACP